MDTTLLKLVLVLDDLHWADQPSLLSELRQGVAGHISRYLMQARKGATGDADIAEVVSDVKERLPDLKPPPQMDSPEQARFRLFDSITAFLKSASLKQPLVLVLDDLHWADQPSLLLLQFVARELGNRHCAISGLAI